MHDHMQYFLEGQDPPPLSNNNKPEIVYRWAVIPGFYSPSYSKRTLLKCRSPSLPSKTLTPTTQSNKALPFIKVIEIKSWEEWSVTRSNVVYIHMSTYLSIQLCVNYWFVDGFLLLLLFLKSSLNGAHGDKAQRSLLAVQSWSNKVPHFWFPLAATESGWLEWAALKRGVNAIKCFICIKVCQLAARQINRR